MAGNGTRSFYGDGGPARYANFDSPAGVLADRYGNVYVSGAAGVAGAPAGGGMGMA